MLTLKTSKSRPAYKNRSILTPAQKTVLALKPRQLLSPTQNHVNFDPKAEVKSISIPTLEARQFCMPPDMKTKLISTQTLEQVIFYPHTKPSQS